MRLCTPLCCDSTPLLLVVLPTQQWGASAKLFGSTPRDFAMGEAIDWHPVWQGGWNIMFWSWKLVGEDSNRFQNRKRISPKNISTGPKFMFDHGCGVSTGPKFMFDHDCSEQRAFKRGQNLCLIMAAGNKGRLNGAKVYVDHGCSEQLAFKRDQSLYLIMFARNKGRLNGAKIYVWSWLQGTNKHVRKVEPKNAIHKFVPKATSQNSAHSSRDRWRCDVVSHEVHVLHENSAGSKFPTGPTVWFCIFWILRWVGKRTFWEP